MKVSTNIAYRVGSLDDAALDALLTKLQSKDHRTRLETLVLNFAFTELSERRREKDLDRIFEGVDGRVGARDSTLDRIFEGLDG